MKFRAMPKHPTVTFSFKDGDIEIDEDLSELLPLMWGIGIDTLYCCQGYVKFKDETVWSNRRFRSYILMRNTEASNTFMQKLLMTFPAFRPKKKVSWEIGYDKHREQGSRICIRFPHSDIPKLVEWIKNTY